MFLFYALIKNYVKFGLLAEGGGRGGRWVVGGEVDRVRSISEDLTCYQVCFLLLLNDLNAIRQGKSYEYMDPRPLHCIALKLSKY